MEILFWLFLFARLLLALLLRLFPMNGGIAVCDVEVAREGSHEAVVLDDSVTHVAAWQIAETVFHWDQPNAIKDHRAEG